MARKKKHEDHQNHEAWAIPYGDLITLLLAFFVVMYSMSAVNEGKYRVLSDSLVAAFRGAPATVTPVQTGETRRGAGGEARLTGVSPTAFMRIRETETREAGKRPPKPVNMNDPKALSRMAGEVRIALQGLIDLGGVRVRETALWLEIEINADILFPSGKAQASPEALPILDRLASIMERFPNAVRVEGHTDNLPISTAVFPSNWELSAARAANVVQRFTRAGVDPLRMEIIGLGEHHPVASNDTVEGRNRNRRVMVVVMQASSGNRRPADLPGLPAGG